MWRSEPTTLGPLPQGAENQCRGRGAFFNSIDSHLTPAVHPPPAAAVQYDEDEQDRSDWHWIPGLCRHICLGVGGWVFIAKKLYVLFILIILRFVFLSPPPSPHFSWDASPAAVSSHWTRSLAASQLEVRKQYVKVCTVFRLEPFSWSILHSMFTLPPTPLPSCLICLQHSCVPLYNKKKRE